MDDHGAVNLLVSHHLLKFLIFLNQLADKVWASNILAHALFNSS